MTHTKRRGPLALALLYALFAGLWILLSDHLLTTLTTDSGLLTLLQNIKGEAFVAATALLLFLLMRREQRRREHRDAKILEFEQRLRLQSAVLESAANAIVITDREGRILWVNPAFSHLTGYGVEEAPGQNLRLLKSGQHEASLYQELWETILSGRVWHGEIVNRRKDGSLYTADLTIAPVRDQRGEISHFIGISHDITERKRAEAALRESQEKFRNLVENTSDWVWEINERGVYTYVSPRVRNILGYAPEELLGKTPFDIMPADEAKRVAEIFAPISGRMESFVLLDNVNLHKAGHRVVLETSGVPIFDSHRRFRGYRGIDRDITSRKTAEEALAKRTRQLEALREVTGEITQELDLTAVLRLITRQAEELVGGESGAIYLWDEAAQVLIPRAWHGLGDWVGEIRRRLDDGVTGIVAARRQGLIVNDYRNSPYRNPIYVERTGITAALAEPLLYRDRLLGVITVNRDENGYPFTEPDRQILSLFAHQAAVAIENAWLHETTVRRAQQLTTLTELTRVLTTVLDSHQVAREILAAAQVLIPDAVGRLWEWSDLDAEPHLVAAVGLRDATGGHRPSRHPGEGVAGLAASTREPVIIPEVTTDPRFLNRAWAEAEGLLSCLILPLLYGDRATGILAIYTRTPHHFVDDEVGLLLSFAGQAAIAIENARLHEAALRRGEQLETLLGAFRSVMSGLDLQGSLDRIVAEAVRSSGCSHVKLLLLDRQNGVLRIGALQGTSLPPEFTFPLGTSLSGLVAQTGQPVYRAEVVTDPLNTLREQDEAAGVVTYLGLPIQSRDEVLGVLTFNTSTPRQYTSEEMAYLMSFAAQAAIAIENARLHGATVRRGEELAALLRATRSVMSGLDLRETLDRILKEASHIVGTPHVKVLLVDREAQVLRLAALAGRPAALLKGFQLPLGVGHSGIVAATGKPLYVRDCPNDPRNLYTDQDRELGLITYLGLPILIRGEILGVLTFNTEEQRQYSPEQIAYLTSFADMAAVAIENARLYQEISQQAITLEQRVQERTRALEAVNRELQAASRHKSAFLANMSHELRTPLNSIIGFAEVLQDQAAGPVTEKQVRFLGHIHQSGKHLLDLINDILDLSKVEAGKLTLKPRALSVAITLGDVLVLTRALAAKKSQRLLIDIEANLPSLQADPVRFKQICFNLMSNAIKFTPTGGSITLTARQVDPETVSRGRGETENRGTAASVAPVRRLTDSPIHGDRKVLEITVRDTGIGIRTEDLPRLFQDFVQLESVETKRHEGTGLGLALTKRLVDLHGGRIWVESEGEGQGSTFTVILPFAGLKEVRQ